MLCFAFALAAEYYGSAAGSGCSPQGVYAALTRTKIAVEEVEVLLPIKNKLEGMTKNNNQAGSQTAFLQMKGSLQDSYEFIPLGNFVHQPILERDCFPG